MSEQLVPILWLDLDGTVRFSHEDLGFWPTSIQDVRIFDGVPDLIAQYKRAGWRIVGQSNQGCIALGTMSRALSEAMIAETNLQCGSMFDVIEFCFHHPRAERLEAASCLCRKPRIGMMVEAQRKLRERYPTEIYPPALGLLVGDLEADRQCALNAGTGFMWAGDWRRANPADIIYQHHRGTNDRLQSLRTRTQQDRDAEPV